MARTLDATEAEIRQEFPEYELIRKEDSRFMKVLDALLRVITFNQARRFMTDFVTTVGDTVYVPSGWDSWKDRSKVVILRHERIHMRQRRRYGSLLYSLLYLLLPLPVVFAYFRARFEKEAYAESMRGWYEVLGDTVWTEENKEAMVRHFTSAEYFWMWPFRKSIERWYDDQVERIRGS